MQKLEELKKSFQSFNEVQDKDIRVWNRCAMAFNAGAKSATLMREYLKQFSPEDMKHIQDMFSRIRKNGYENTKREIMVNNSKKIHEEVEYA